MVTLCADRLEAQRPALLKFCASTLSWAGEADDIVQGAMIKAWTARASYDGRDLKNWLFRIAQHLAISTHRSSRKLKTVSHDMHSMEEDHMRHFSHDGGMAQVTEMGMDEAMDFYGLTEKEKVMFQFVMDRKIGDCPSAIGMTRSALKNQLYRARKRLGGME